MHLIKVFFKDLEQFIAKRLNRFPKIKKNIKYARHLLFRPNHKYYVSSDYELIDLFNGSSKQIFFGYYTNKALNGNELLFNETALESPNIANTDYIELFCININTKNITKIGESYSWNWQQGCMLQWVSKENKIVIFNDYDVEQEGYVTIIYDVESGNEIHRLDMPYNAVHWEEKYLLSINYDRLSLFRPDYGYSAKIPQQDFNNEKDGIWILPIESKVKRLLINIEELRVATDHSLDKSLNQWVNHILFNPSMNKFVFLYRWSVNGRIKSALFLYDVLKDELKKLLVSEIISHYDWYTDKELIIFSKIEGNTSGYYILNVDKFRMDKIGKTFFTGDGHPRVILGSSFFITDTYPDKSRLAKLLRYDLATEKGERIAEFYQPLDFDLEYRCDLHPRLNLESNYISFDSAHTGRRKQYLIKLSKS